MEVFGGLMVFGVLVGLIWGSSGFGVSDFEFLDYGFWILDFGFRAFGDWVLCFGAFRFWVFCFWILEKCLVFGVWCLVFSL